MQIAVAAQISIFGATPDFILAAIGPLSVSISPRGGAAVGFLGGLLQGALAGADLTHYVISRCLAGFFTSLTRGIGLELSIAVIAVTTAACTIVGQLLLMFLAPPPEIMRFVGATIGTAIYNGVIAIPLYMLLRRLFRPK